MDEAPSVWTTSKALVALAVTKFTPNPEEALKLEESVIWLSKQAYSNDETAGWGYQKYNSDPCKDSVPMTALALKALCLSLKCKYVRERQIIGIKDVIEKGLEYLKANIHEKDDECYWQYDNKPNLSASVWAMEAWKLACESLENGRFKDDAMAEYNRLLPRVIPFVLKNLPNNYNESVSECFFHAPRGSDLKYKPNLQKDKNFYSFTPYFVSYLLEIDSKEYVGKTEVVGVIKWIVAHHNNSWLIQKNYNSDGPCSITAAMAINVIVKWLQSLVGLVDVSLDQFDAEGD